MSVTRYTRQPRQREREALNDFSNGQVEGQNNRLKMLKRQMFGRAGLDLLAKRLILERPTLKPDLALRV